MGHPSALVLYAHIYIYIYIYMATSVLLLHFPLYPPSEAERATFEEPVHIHLNKQVAHGTKCPVAAKLQDLLGLFRLLHAHYRPGELRLASTPRFP